MRRLPVLATLALLLVHGGLLAASIPNYRVTIDSAYHVSMGGDYGRHGLVPWDRINFGPRGRPNLQGPLLHAAIGGLGWLLGGRGDDYVLANAILSVIQWASAMGTVAFFAFWLGGEIAMLLAVALLSGAAFAATSFAVGIPSGWLFVFTPWAIWLFLEERLPAASLLGALAIYSHIGGYLTAPFGIAIAALLTRRWHQFCLCGAAIAALTLPYTIHIIRYAGWFSGVKSYAALLIDPMLDVLAVAGSLRLLRNPRAHPFMAAWLIAPIAWLFQDPGRFLLQWPLGGSVAAGLWLVNKLAPFEARQRIRYALGFTAIATVLPFGLPSISGEIAWTAGNHFPLAVDWSGTRRIAVRITQAGLTHALIADYSPMLCPAIALYADVSCENGDWVEVQPLRDPADDIPAAQKTYVISLPSSDPMLQAMRSRGWLMVYPDDYPSAGSSVARLAQRPSISDAAVAASAIIRAEAEWLGRNGVDNALSFADLFRIASASGRDQFRSALAIQRVHAGRIELACLIYAWALESDYPLDARAMRQVTLKLGVIASYLSDEYALDFLSASRLAELKEQFLELSTRANRLAFDPSPSPELMDNFNSLIGTILEKRGEMFTGRPSGDWLSWLFG